MGWGLDEENQKVKEVHARWRRRRRRSTAYTTVGKQICVCPRCSKQVVSSKTRFQPRRRVQAGKCSQSTAVIQVRPCMLPPNSLDHTVLWFLFPDELTTGNTDTNPCRDIHLHTQHTDTTLKMPISAFSSFCSGQTFVTYVRSMQAAASIRFEVLRQAPALAASPTPASAFACDVWMCGKNDSN